MSSTTTLDTLLERHRDADRVQYSVGANHAPMVLIALHRLGADDTELQRYYRGLKVETPKADNEQGPFHENSWESRLGDLNAASAYCRFFESQIERYGCERVLQRYLSPLMTGVAAHAFHPLLRLAYGVDLDDEREIAFGLGYWCATYLPAPESSTEKTSVGPAELMKTLADSPSLRVLEPETNSIAGRIGRFYAHEDFRTQLRPVHFDPEEPLEEISLIIAEAFVEKHHFAMLHGVTGCHALRLVAPYLENLPKAISEYWYSVCATYLSVVNLEADMRHPLPETSEDWPRIRDRAIETRIEHTIKLAYTCSMETEVYGRDLYRKIALREIDRAAPFF